MCIRRQAVVAQITSQGNLAVIVKAVQVYSLAIDLVSGFNNMILSFTHLVLISIFDIQMYVMFIMIQFKSKTNIYLLFKM